MVSGYGLALTASIVSVVIALTIMHARNHGRERFLPWPYGVEDEMAGRQLAQSSLQPALPAAGRVEGGGARIETLRCSAVPISPSQSLVRIRFVLLNGLAHPVTFDDLHAKVYCRKVIRPLLASIDSYGYVDLACDNTLWKDERASLIQPFGGLEITVGVAATRFEGLTLSSGEARGGLVVVFGLLADCFFLEPSGSLRRFVVPSDCVYLLRHDQAGTPSISAWNEEIPTAPVPSVDSELARRVRVHASQHRSFHGMPKA